MDDAKLQKGNDLKQIKVTADVRVHTLKTELSYIKTDQYVGHKLKPVRVTFNVRNTVFDRNPTPYKVQFTIPYDYLIDLKIKEIKAAEKELSQAEENYKKL
jgi:hypothetical protein